MIVLQVFGTSILAVIGYFVSIWLCLNDALQTKDKAFTIALVTFQTLFQ